MQHKGSEIRFPQNDQERAALKLGEFKSPIFGLPNIFSNEVLTVCFDDPYYEDDYMFLATRLPNAVDPPDVLAPQTRSEGYKPNIGFTRNLPNAYITPVGHRMLNANMDFRYHNSGASNFNNHRRGAIPNQYGNPYGNQYGNQQSNRHNPNVHHGTSNQNYSRPRYNNHIAPRNDYQRSNYRHNNKRF